MFKNYFKIACRSFARAKLFSSINLLGLIIGMMVSLLMLVYVQHENSFEKFHAHNEDIYRIAVTWGTDSHRMPMAGAMPALAPALNADVPEVEKAIRIRPAHEAVIKIDANQEYHESNVFFCDPGLFEIFSVHVVSGSGDEALEQPGTILLSQSSAEKYFTSEDAIGKTVFFQDVPLQVAGIFKDVPATTHLPFEQVISFSTLQSMGKLPGNLWQSWGSDFTYALLKKNVDIEAFAAKLDAMLAANAGEWFATNMDFIIQPLSDIHWNAELRGDIGPKGNRMYVYIFLSAAVLVLLIASFNFMNLSTARYLERMKEVGVRKASGANRSQLFAQFLSESILFAAIAMVIAFMFFKVSAPHFYSFLNTDFILNTEFYRISILLAVGLFLFVSFFAGSYPALLLSRFQPVEILKGKSNSIALKSSFRTYSVVAQFTISIFLIICTLLIYRQLNYMRHSDLGFEQGGVALLRYPSARTTVHDNYETLKNEILNLPGVLAASSAYTAPGISSLMSVGVLPEGAGDDEAQTMQALPVDFGFVNSMGLQLVQGRDFSKEFTTDNESGLLLNETAVAALGLETPVGAMLQVPRDGKFRTMNVIGVVRDFPVQSLQNKISPMLLYIDPQAAIVMAVKIQPEHTQQTLQRMQNIWQRIVPEAEFNYIFLEDAYAGLYRNEQNAGELLLIFATLAIVISCLGLLGLATFTTSRRIKEIAVRKVLGASVTGIATLLAQDFVKLVLLANILAWPLAWYAMHKWLQNFAYRTEIDWWVFALSGSIALAIALFTISWRAMRAANVNPVEALKYE